MPLDEKGVYFAYAQTVDNSTGKYAAHGKATLVNIFGREGAHARLDTLVAEAESALAPFVAVAGTLHAA